MPSPSLISKLEVFRVPPRWLFVRVQTEDGLVGWGEGTLEGHAEAIEGAFEDLRDTFVGCDADRIEDIWQHAYRARVYRGGPVLMSAMSGLDIALWDIKGKKLGVPVWQLLGGKVRDRVKVYSWIGGDHPNDVYSAARVRKSQGFTAVKMNATDLIDWIDSPSLLDSAVTRVREVRSLGLDVGVDFHGRVHKGMARQLAHALEPHGPLFIEEPLLPTQPQEIADLAHSVSTQVALGERLYTRTDFRPYFERRAIDIAQPDVRGFSLAYEGGSMDVALAPHCPLGPIALAACMQVDISAPNFMIQEMSWQVHVLQPRLTRHACADHLVNPSVFDIENGHIAALTGNGIGVEINEARVREACVGQKAWRNAVCRGKDGSLRDW